MSDETYNGLFNDSTLYKCLDGNKSCHGGRGEWTPGRWRSTKGDPQACVRGIHYCKGAQVLEWLSPDLWLFEDGGTKHDDQHDKCVTNRGRVTKRIETWNDETARLFAADCARLAVNRYAETDRELLHACVDMSIAHALGLSDAAAESAARSAAESAAESAARSAAWGAAWSAAWGAAWGAARTEQYSLLCRYLNGEQGPFVEAVS